MASEMAMSDEGTPKRVSNVGNVGASLLTSPYLTIEELGAYLKQSPHTIRAWRKQDILPPAFKPGGKLLWHKDEIDRWMRDCQQKAALRVHHRLRSHRVSPRKE